MNFQDPFLIISTNKAWYDESWFLALASAFLGAAATLFFQFLMGLVKRSFLKRRLARDLSVEIYANARNCEKLDKLVESTLDEFRRAIAVDPPSSHPSLVRTGMEISTVYFDSHFGDLHLLPRYLRHQVYFFYEKHTKNITESSRIVQYAFEKYYANDSMISARDIINRLDEYRLLIRELVSSGFELTGSLLPLSGDHRSLVPGSEERHHRSREKMEGYFRKIGIGQVITIPHLMECFEIDVITAVLFITENRRFEKVGPGKYRKVQRFRTVKRHFMNLYLSLRFRLKSFFDWEAGEKDHEE